MGNVYFLMALMDSVEGGGRMEEAISHQENYHQNYFPTRQITAGFCFSKMDPALRSRTSGHQQESRSLLSASIFPVFSPAKIGRLWTFYFYEVDTWLTEVHFCALSATFRHFQHFESDQAIP